MAISTEEYTGRPKGMLPNSRFPLLIHRGAVPDGGAKAVRALFAGMDG